MSKLKTVVLCICLLPSSAAYSQSSVSLGERYAIIIGGIGGQQVFTEKYFEQTTRMYDLLTQGLRYDEENIIYLFEDTGYDSVRIDQAATAQYVKQAFKTAGEKMTPEDQLFVFLVGHGTFDGRWSKFNLVGPDLRGIDYAKLLAELPTRRIVFVNTSSASGPFIKTLSAEERVIITATKSGTQYHETSFADFFLDALSGTDSDFNKDGKVSMLEAFQYARRQQDQLYEDERRLRTEHPLLDDNGDGEGSQAPDDSDDGRWASRVSLYPVSPELQVTLEKAEAGTLSPADSLRLEKARLTTAVEDLKAKKDQLSSEEYAKQLESLLIRLAKVNRELQQQRGAGGE